MNDGFSKPQIESYWGLHFFGSLNLKSFAKLVKLCNGWEPRCCFSQAFNLYKKDLQHIYQADLKIYQVNMNLNQLQTSHFCIHYNYQILGGQQKEDSQLIHFFGAKFAVDASFDNWGFFLVQVFSADSLTFIFENPIVWFGLRLICETLRDD